MSREHYRFPKIRQFRHVLRYLLEYQPDLEEIDFVGATKLHGTNAAVVITRGDVYAQSRNRVITPEKDNYGFAKWVDENHEALNIEDIRSKMFRTRAVRAVVIYGEWAGPRIAKGAAICRIPERRFFPFNHNRIVYDSGGQAWNRDRMTGLRGPEELGGLFCLTLNVKDPAPSEKLMHDLTMQVERLCPVAHELGVDGVGEGLVWWPRYESLGASQLVFKTKGNKHSESKVKKVKKVDPEKKARVKAFVEGVVTDARIEHAMAWLDEMGHERCRTSTGQFLRYIGNDILEEESDLMEEMGLERRDVMKRVNAAACEKFFEEVG